MWPRRVRVQVPSVTPNTTTTDRDIMADTQGTIGCKHHSPRQVSRVMDSVDVARAISRIAQEIVERNRGAASLLLLGLQKSGVWIAEQIAAAISETENIDVPCGALDVSLHRDDIGMRPLSSQHKTMIPVDVDNRTVVLVDDVLYTGRTVRAAMDALNSWCRPNAVQLAVVADRGHRELPISADYLGKYLPTSRDETVRVSPFFGVWIAKPA